MLLFLVAADTNQAGKTCSEKPYSTGNRYSRSSSFSHSDNANVWIYTITHQPKGIPVEAYLSRQGRFSHLTAGQIAIIQENVDRQWDRLVGRCEGRLH